MPENTPAEDFDQQMLRLQEFLRDNPGDEWKWSDIYEVLSLPIIERSAFRKRVLRAWTTGALPWLAMSTRRGRGGLGGLRLSSEHDLQEEWETWLKVAMSDSRHRFPANTKSLLTRMLDEGVIDFGGADNGGRR